jgi:hypothetical protein
MIDREHTPSVKRQCELLESFRSGYYYTPVPVSEKNMELMRQIDEIHLFYPFYGSRKIRTELWARGYDIGRDKVRRLMHQVWIKKTNTGEPPYTCRKCTDGVKTEEVILPRYRGGVSLVRALMMNCGNLVAAMSRERRKRRIREADSIDARHRGGHVRSS